jgi:hypothetical protein
MRSKKLSIRVFKKCTKHYIPDGDCKDCQLIETIDRVPFNKGFIGNFVPHWCRYKNQRHLIRGSIDYSYMHGYDNDAFIVLD